MVSLLVIEGLVAYSISLEILSLYGRSGSFVGTIRSLGVYLASSTTSLGGRVSLLVLDSLS